MIQLNYVMMDKITKAQEDYTSGESDVHPIKVALGLLCPPRPRNNKKNPIDRIVDEIQHEAQAEVYRPRTRRSGGNYGVAAYRHNH